MALIKKHKPKHHKGKEVEDKGKDGKEGKSETKLRGKVHKKVGHKKESED
ncbi:MAG TPA: hypothetical protein VNX65_04290 [Patescibacteria group bacterium]|nr:hypothetical protein [Patescibacteria group bacterium]